MEQEISQLERVSSAALPSLEFWRRIFLQTRLAQLKKDVSQLEVSLSELPEIIWNWLPQGSFDKVEENGCRCGDGASHPSAAAISREL
jgi:hypothetical protein